MRLVGGAGLLPQTFVHFRRTGIGIDARNLLTMAAPPPVAKYRNNANAAFYQPVADRVSALPGVRGSGWISMLPVYAWVANRTFRIAGRPPARPGSKPFAKDRTVSPGYFRAMGIPDPPGAELLASNRPPPPLPSAARLDPLETMRGE